MSKKEIALVIISQLGGLSKLNSMLGLKQTTIIDNGVFFRYKVSSPINYIKIELNSLDLYNIEMGKVHGLNYKLIKKIDDVFVDDIMSIIEDVCKVNLSL